ncbi:MAG: HEPN domain-containing protein [Chitinophagales bacterium]
MAIDYQDWITKAENDWKVVKLIIKNNYDPEDILCYHCHQVAEKYLKGFLLYKYQPNIPIHDLLKLVDQILSIEPGFSIIKTKVKVLNLYAVRPKYPDDYFAPLKSDCDEAIEAAKMVRKFCRQMMKPDKKKSKS